MGVRNRKPKPGRAGGLALVEKYGIEYMRTIGARGGKAFWARYTLRPVGLASFAIVDRRTDKVVGFTTSEFVDHVNAATAR